MQSQRGMKLSGRALNTSREVSRTRCGPTSRYLRRRRGP